MQEYIICTLTFCSYVGLYKEIIYGLVLQLALFGLHCTGAATYVTPTELELEQFEQYQSSP